MFPAQISIVVVVWNGLTVNNLMASTCIGAAVWLVRRFDRSVLWSIGQLMRANKNALGPRTEQIANLEPWESLGAIGGASQPVLLSLDKLIPIFHQL